MRERAGDERAKSSGRDLPDGLAPSVLVKLLPANIGNHVQLQMSETSDYASVKSIVLSYERMWLQHGVDAKLMLNGVFLEVSLHIQLVITEVHLWMSIALPVVGKKKKLYRWQPRKIRQRERKRHMKRKRTKKHWKVERDI